MHFYSIIFFLLPALCTFILYFFLTPDTLHFYSIIFFLLPALCTFILYFFSYSRHFALLFYTFFLNPGTLHFYSILFFLLPCSLCYTFFRTAKPPYTFCLTFLFSHFSLYRLLSFFPNPYIFLLFSYFLKGQGRKLPD